MTTHTPYIIRSETIEQWLRANFEMSELEDIVNHGCQSGFHHLIYYNETGYFYNHFQDEIWQLACDESEEFGCKNVFELIAGFSGSNQVSDNATMKNLLAWFAVEEVSRRIIEEE